MNKIISEAKSIATAAKDGLVQSKRALDASIEISRSDQRAWVGMTEILPQWVDSSNKPMFLKEGSYYQVGVTIVNSGKTPALNVKPKIRLLPFSSEDKFYPDFGDLKEQSDGVIEGQTVGVIQPQGALKLISAPSYKKVRSSDLESLKNGSLVLFLYGEIQYEDIFGVAHQTTFCSTLASTLDRFNVCSSYNDAN